MFTVAVFALGMLAGVVAACRSSPSRANYWLACLSGGVCWFGMVQAIMELRS